MCVNMILKGERESKRERESEKSLNTIQNENMTWYRIILLIGNYLRV